MIEQFYKQLLLIDKTNNPNTNFYVPIAALQITYLETIDAQSPRNIVL